jgi:hypothetical protein
LTGIAAADHTVAMRVGVLGSVSVDDDATSLSPRDRVVLAALVVCYDRPADTNLLSGALWGTRRRVAALDEPERPAHILGEALALWRGPALADRDGWGTPPPPESRSCPYMGSVPASTAASHRGTVGSARCSAAWLSAGPTPPCSWRTGPAATHTVSVMTVDSEVYELDTRVAHWVEFACDVAGRNLTRAEWHDIFGDRPYRETC